MGTGLAKSTLQHTLSFSTVALASQWHLLTPLLMLLIYISVTNCTWEAFGHGHMKGWKKPCPLWRLLLRLLLQLGPCFSAGWVWVSAPSPSCCAARPLAARRLPFPATSPPHGKPRGSPCFNLGSLCFIRKMPGTPAWLCSLPPSGFRPAHFQAESRSRA